MFKSRRVSAASLVTSKLFDENTFSRAFERDLKKAQSSVIIESPFMTERRALQYARIFKRLKKQGVKVRVNTRNPRHHDPPLEAQAWKALFILKDVGVKVRTYNDLRHRKLAIIDKGTLWEGSLNILSQNNSRETMRRTQSDELAQQMLRFTKVDNWYQ